MCKNRGSLQRLYLSVQPRRSDACVDVHRKKVLRNRRRFFARKPARRAGAICAILPSFTEGQLRFCFFPPSRMPQTKVCNAYILDTYKQMETGKHLPGAILYCGRKKLETKQWDMAFETLEEANEFVRDYCTKLGIAIPFLPVCRGPTVLKTRTMTPGSFFSRQ